jgi:hypothetical protein
MSPASRSAYFVRVEPHVVQLLGEPLAASCEGLAVGFHGVVPAPVDVLERQLFFHGSWLDGRLATFLVGGALNLGDL